MDSTIFSLWATEFLLETEDLRRRKGRLLLLLDGMDAHLKYNSLKTLKDTGIVVVALPAHTSHALQPLDLSVFSSTKEKFRQLLSERTISTRRDLDNHIFVIAEMITKVYEHSLSMVNIKAGFRASGIWPLDPERVLRKYGHAIRNDTNTTGEQRQIITDDSDVPIRQIFLARHKELAGRGWIGSRNQFCDKKVRSNKDLG